MTNIEAVKEANKQAGYHFFDDIVVTLLHSVVETEVYKEKYFVTSEQFANLPRNFTVRCAHDDGSITTVGKFHAIPSLSEAQAIIEGLL